MLCAEDVHEVALMEQRCFSCPWTEADFNTVLNSKSSVHINAFADGVLAGYVTMACVLDEGQIMNVAVDEPFRRNGIARALIGKLFEVGDERKLTLYTLEVREKNTPARRLYEGLGFKAVGVRKDYYSEPTDNAVLMDLERIVKDKDNA